MNVQRPSSAPDPGYPDAKEFRRQRHLLGLAVIGTGLAVGACTPPPTRTAGVPAPAPPPTRLGGVAPLVRLQLDTGAGAPANAVPEPAKDEPRKESPPRLPGKIKVEPKPPPPKEEKPPRLPGAPPPPPR